jgi:hypothetical protein
LKRSSSGRKSSDVGERIRGKNSDSAGRGIRPWHYKYVLLRLRMKTSRGKQQEDYTTRDDVLILH